MTDERDFDRLARAWLDLSPDLAPERSVEAVLQAVETTPQVRPWFRWPSGRNTIMSRYMPIAAVVAVAVVTVGGLYMLGRQDQGVVGAPSTAPSAAATASPSIVAAGTIPAELRYRWIGEPRPIGSKSASSRTALNLTQDSYYLTGTEYLTSGLMGSLASLSAPGTIAVVTPTAGDSLCAGGDAGTYSYVLAPRGTRLTVTPVSDDCAARSDAMSGDWFRVACKDPQDACWGDLEAGTYPSQYVAPRLDPTETWTVPFGALAFTVPDGWANAEDWPDLFSLVPAADYADYGPTGGPKDSYHGIYVQTLPAATDQTATCANAERTDIARTPDGLIAWVASRPGLVASAPQDITIGGHSGKSIDVKLSPDQTATCPDATGPVAVFLTRASGGTGAWSWGIGGVEQQRLIFLDLGGGHTVLIGIDSTDPARYDQLVQEAMPIIQTFTFK